MNANPKSMTLMSVAKHMLQLRSFKFIDLLMPPQHCLWVFQTVMNGLIFSKKDGVKGYWL